MHAKIFVVLCCASFSTYLAGLLSMNVMIPLYDPTLPSYFFIYVIAVTLLMIFGGSLISLAALQKLGVLPLLTDNMVLPAQWFQLEWALPRLRKTGRPSGGSPLLDDDRRNGLAAPLLEEP